MKKPTPFGKYFLLERINVGGMAEVFRAKAFGVEGFERLVAVKRILANIAEDKEFIRMFIEEAKLSVQLNHANIAQIFDLGVVDSSYYIALEHVHGRDLRGVYDRCRQLGEAMPVAQACFIAMKVCEGLDYAHNKRDQAGRELSLVHRDVSPQNILVSFEGEVKLIDFGIAKAAGTGGSKTQAGILKGKFGYMSPEQVRGLQVDRRSDVFSCGIVLYELLTGERLFVGESDFSTLEKVRNVEILPPSTYNRKIPEELERIVLKALTKEAEDRYQNAIDLHDELQAFVYTAGEFYSRKDLAGWMKKTFTKEIEEETAKLESFRQLKPPAIPEGMDTEVVPLAAPVPPPTPPPRRAQAPTPHRTTQSQAVVKPVASSVSRSQPVAVIPPPSVSRSQPIAVIPPSASRSQPIAAIQPVSRSYPIASLPLQASPTLPPSQGAQALQANQDAVPQASDEPHRPGPSSWEDDDLETRIYQDDEQRQKSNRANLPLQPPVTSSPALVLSPMDQESDPDISPVPAEWPADVSIALVPRPRSGSGAHRSGRSTAPPPVPNGSSNAPLPPDPRFEANGREPAVVLGRELSAGNRLVEAAPTELPYDPPSRPVGARGGRSTGAPGARQAGRPTGQGASAPTHLSAPMPAFGARITAGRRAPTSDRQRTILTYAIGGAAALAILVIIILLVSGRSKPTPPPPPAPRPSPAVAADPSTGFDLYVTPAGITQWKLDGESRTDRLPSRIRGIAAGSHTVQIDPPPGFLSQHQQVAVELGKASRVEIKLQPISGITGVFESAPPGAAVSLIIDGRRQAIGLSPAKAPLDPRSSYQVLFEKPGYVSVNRPVTFSGGLEERIVANLELAQATPPPNVTPPRPPVTPPPPATHDNHKTVRPPDRAAPDRVGSDVSESAPDKAESPDAKAQGVLVLGSKPPCEIAIDGNATGLHTPQKEIKLSVGRHRVTLSNLEFNIRDSFTVDIKADAPEKMIKDYSDQLPK